MLESVVQSLVSGFPALALQFVVALAMLAAGVALYVLMTPMREIQLIRANNAAAALATAGAMVAMAIPLAAVIVSSVNVVDVLIFGVVALLLQLLADFVTHALLRELPQRIVKGEIAAAIILIGIKVSVALLNAAAVTV